MGHGMDFFSKGFYRRFGGQEEEESRKWGAEPSRADRETIGCGHIFNWSHWLPSPSSLDVLCCDYCQSLSEMNNYTIFYKIYNYLTNSF